MGKDIHEIADDLRTAYRHGRSQAAMAALLADQVEVRHYPAEPSDGSMDRAVLAPALARDQLLKSARGLFRELTAITIEDDRIDMATRIFGALPDGVRIDVASRIVCTIREGKIVGIDSHPDVEASKPLKAFAMSLQPAREQAST